jgi:hypothetical protein
MSNDEFENNNNKQPKKKLNLIGPGHETKITL